MIAKYNRISLLLGVPGIILQIVGHFLGGIPAKGQIAHPLGSLLMLAGTGLLLVGLAYYAKSKGHSPAWCLMAFLSIIGLIVLACLKDKAVATQAAPPPIPPSAPHEPAELPEGAPAPPQE